MSSSTIPGSAKRKDTAITILMTGDVMLGRGVDQILPQPSNPILFESYVKDARDYVMLAEKKNGPISYPVDHAYIWGDALTELHRYDPDVKMINLETSITTHNGYWEGKGINYRMHPFNAKSLLIAEIDYCALANNHVLDWGYPGFVETLDVLESLSIHYSGGGLNHESAQRPAIVDITDKGRVIIFSFGHGSSGIPTAWAATATKPGVNVLPDFSTTTILEIKKAVTQVKQPGDIVIFSIHWGGNWGYEIDDRQQQFALKLIDLANIDIIHGHSAHHVKGIEVYNNKLILYGCGDFLNDYEGIRGHEMYRGDLALMYFPSVDPSTGNLLHLTMVPTQMKKLRINRANDSDAQWLLTTLNREGKKLGTSVKQENDSSFSLKW